MQKWIHYGQWGWREVFHSSSGWVREESNCRGAWGDAFFRWDVGELDLPQVSPKPHFESTNHTFLVYYLHITNPFFSKICTLFKVQQKDEAIVKKELAHHPDILCPQVMRSDFVVEEGETLKVKKVITLSPKLVVQGVTYHLNFVIFHSGNQASEGHYTCLAKDLFSNSWHKFTDKSAIKLKLSETACTASLLVYKKALEYNQKTTSMIQELGRLRAQVMTRGM